ENVNRYFLQVGWLPATQGNAIALPDSNSLWTANRDTLTPETPVTFTWRNPQGITFSVEVALDNDYLFTVTQQVTNPTGQTVEVMPYGLANRAVPESSRFSTIMHTGPIGVFDGTLTETSFGDLKDDRTEKYADTKGWVGVADEYWLTTFIP